MDKVFDNLTPDTTAEPSWHDRREGSADKGPQSDLARWAAGSGFNGLIYSLLPLRNSRTVTILRAWSTAIAIARYSLKLAGVQAGKPEPDSPREGPPCPPGKSFG